MHPLWRCRQGHEFDAPQVEYSTVRTYEARYGETFQALKGALRVEHLDSAVMRPSDQMSIKEIDASVLARLLAGHEPAMLLISQFAAALGVDDPPSPTSDDPTTLVDNRRRVLREIALRRGQPQFRRRLIRKYGENCQVSLCSCLKLVEAAHIDPFSESGDNRVGNGILLRSDLHTLFDLALLGIEPETLRVAIKPEAAKAGYGIFDGATLFTNATSGPAYRVLQKRWKMFI